MLILNIQQGYESVMCPQSAMLQSKSGASCFTPQLLTNFTKIVIFGPYLMNIFSASNDELAGCSPS